MRNAILKTMFLAGLLCGPARFLAADSPPSSPGQTTPLPASSGQAPQSDESASKPESRVLLLRYKFREGDTAAYRLVVEGRGTAAMTAAPIQLPIFLSMEMAVDQRVVKIREGELAELQVKYRIIRCEVNQVELSASALSPPPVTALVTPSGSIIEWKEEGTGQATSALLAGDPAGIAHLTQRLAFPGHPVRVGESWAGEGSANAEQRHESTLVAIDRDKGREIARVKQVFAIPVRTKGTDPLGGTIDISGRQAGDLMIRFDPDAGRVVGGDGNVDYVATLKSIAGATDLRLKLRLRIQDMPASQ